jgi:hypothetical protein
LRPILFLSLIFQLTTFVVSAQTVADSIPVTRDTVKVAGDSIPTIVNQVVLDSVSRRPELLIPAWEAQTDLPFSVQILKQHPFFNFRVKPFVVPTGIKVFKGKETFFYVIMGLVLAFALLRITFAKYFYDLFRVFFRTTMKQRQIREQLMQTPLPSLGFNLFFIASAGLYIDFLLYHFGFKPVDNFWVLYLYCCAGLSAIYLGKFISLKICGWMFNMRQAADSYIFIVFIINKVIGIFLLPFLVLLAFSAEPVRSIGMTLSWLGIGLLLVYRFILGYSAVRNEVRFNLFHFFLYICAFEIAPLLLIYRLLLFFFK